jgi:PAS domain-containing protein
MGKLISVCEHDGEMNILFENRMARRIFGRQREDVTKTEKTAQ